MQTGSVPVLFFSFSGLRGTGRTTIYQKLKASLPARFPEKEFAFIGSPFSSLPLPLTWEKSERDKNATTRLLECWARLNEFSLTKLRPNLERGRIVISDGFGLDALLYATACCDCVDQNHEAQEMHHLFVKARIKAQNLPPPEYLLVKADHRKVEQWILRSTPDLKDTTDQLQRERFIRHEEHIIDQYFDPQTGQRMPFILDATVHSIAALGEIAEQFIAQQIEQKARAA